MSFFKKILQSVLGVFTKRSRRIAFAKKVAKAMVAFSKDTAAINIITYVIDAIAPETATAVNTAKNFLVDASPVLFKVFDIMDASDQSTITEDNIEDVCKEFNKLGTVADENALAACVSRYIKNDGKLSMLEAYDLVNNNFKK